MGTTFWGIEIGTRALRTQQKALDTTGHNIANANTRGYTRQQAIISPTSPYAMPGFNSPLGAGQMGTGVYIEEIRRIRDSFTDLQIRDELESLGSWEQKSSYLEKIGVIFNEPSDAGLRSVFSKFFDSLHNLAGKADDPTTRTLVIEQGNTLADTFNHMTRQFRDSALAIEATLKAKVNEVNSYSRQIRDLNEQIVRIENSGDNANDLRDKRDILLDDLAKLISIDYMEMEDGSVLVSTGGRSLVQSVYFKELELKTYDGTEPGKEDLKGSPKIIWKDSGEEYQFIKVNSPAQSGTALGTVLSGAIELHKARGAAAGDIAYPNYADNNSGPNVTIANNELTITINGTAHTVNLAVANYSTGDDDGAQDFLNDLQSKLDGAFGPGIVNVSFNSANQVVFDSGNPADAIFITGTALEHLGEISSADPANNVISFTLDGITKNITISDAYLGTYDSTDQTEMDNLAGYLTAEINNAYAGTGASLQVTWDNAGKNFVVASASKGANSSIWGFAGLGAELLGLSKAAVTPGKNEEITITGGGEISGLWEVRSRIIPGYIDNLNNLMARFADTFNNQHNKGYDLKGNLGKNFFGLTPEAENDVIAARYLSVMINDPNELAASATVDGLPGDGDNAWKLAGLRDNPVMNQGKATLDEYVQSVVAGLGIESQAALRMVDNQNLLVAQIENQRQSFSGVSLDEEMTNLVKFQHAYGAAARLVTTVDEMLEVIISRLGVVGR